MNKKYGLAVVITALIVGAGILYVIYPGSSNGNGGSGSEGSNNLAFNFTYDSYPTGGETLYNITTSRDMEPIESFSLEQVRVQCDRSIISNESLSHIASLFGINDIFSSDLVEITKESYSGSYHGIAYNTTTIDIVLYNDTSHTIARKILRFEYKYSDTDSSCRITYSHNSIFNNGSYFPTEEERKEKFENFYEKVKELFPKNVELKQHFGPCSWVNSANGGETPVGWAMSYSAYMDSILLGNFIYASDDEMGNIDSFEVLTGEFSKDSSQKAVFPSSDTLISWMRSNGVPVYAPGKIIKVEVTNITPQWAYTIYVEPVYKVSLNVTYEVEVYEWPNTTTRTEIYNASYNGTYNESQGDDVDNNEPKIVTKTEYRETQVVVFWTTSNDEDG